MRALGVASRCFTRAPQSVGGARSGTYGAGLIIGGAILLLGTESRTRNMPSSFTRFGLDTLRHAGTNRRGASLAAPMSGFCDEGERIPRASRGDQRIESPNAGMAMGRT